MYNLRKLRNAVTICIMFLVLGILLSCGCIPRTKTTKTTELHTVLPIDKLRKLANSTLISGSEDQIISLTLSDGKLNLTYKFMPLISGEIEAPRRTSRFLAEALADSNVQKVVIITHLPFKEVTGHTRWDKALSVTMTKETWQTIDWSGFEYRNLKHVADDYWAAPQLN